jgi:two-component system, LytTR family, response regulator
MTNANHPNERIVRHPDSYSSGGPAKPAPVRAILIDDEPLARQIVQEFLQAYPGITVLQECSDGFEGLKAIQQHHPDLIFLDIQMPKINGFEMLELVEDPPDTIFTTAFDEYAIRAFETHAVDYLLKPFSKERFDKAVRKWLEHHADRVAARGATPAASQGPSLPAGTSSNAATQPAVSGAESPDNTSALLETASRSPAQQQRVVVKTAGKIKIIPLDDIHYLEASDDYVRIHTHNGVFLKNRTMSYFEQVLDPNRFVRTHRSYIINVQQVTRIDPYEKDSHLCVLAAGAQVPVSKAGYMKLKAVLGL